MRWTASKLSRHCAHHHVLSELTPKPSRDKAAAKGTLFHIALASWHRSGVIPPHDDRDLGEWLQTMVDNGWAWPDGCELEVAWGLDKWGKFCAVREDPPDSHVYVPLDGMSDLLTAGRADACWMTGDVLVSCDWKTGRTLAPAARINLQVNAAGIALAQKWKARAYVPAIYYAREGRWDIGDEVDMERRFEPGQPWEWIATASGLDDKPHPGEHCGTCWERKNCEAA